MERLNAKGILTIVAALYIFAELLAGIVGMVLWETRYLLKFLAYF